MTKLDKLNTLFAPFKEFMVLMDIAEGLTDPAEVARSNNKCTEQYELMKVNMPEINKILNVPKTNINVTRSRNKKNSAAKPL